MLETFSPLRWHDGALDLLDQTRLPWEEVWLTCREPEQVADAIRRLAVRGAPAIGVAAAYGLVLGIQDVQHAEQLADRFDEVSKLLAGTRPTAVNLRWALDRGKRVFETALADDPSQVSSALLAWACGTHQADIEANRRMGAYGEKLFTSGDRVLTHCNTGALATAGFGTALGVIRSSWEQGKIRQVWVDETRPLLQGARLTAWELEQLGIPYRVITDSSSGTLMARGLVDRIVLGADRIAVNGDVANKVGTYTLAVLASRHKIPFYVAAPLSTIDPDTPSGSEIPIEERDPTEVTRLSGQLLAPQAAAALNYAFDVTPNELITAIITEVGVLEPPFHESIARALASQSL